MAAMLVAVSLLAAYAYVRIEQRLLQDARFLVDLHLKQMSETLAAAPGDDAALANYAERSTTAGGPDLKLGLQVFGPDGRLRLASGTLADNPVPLPASLPDDPKDRVARHVDFPGEKYPYLVLTRRLPDGGAVQGAVYLRRFIRNARGVRDIFLWALPLAGALTFVLGGWLVRGSLRPIASITRAAQHISGTHLEERIPTTGSGDELDQLANTLNDMMQRIRRSVERMQRFSANAAHELRTPLNALRSRLEVTLEQPRSADEYRKILGETAEEVASFSDSVHAMLRLAQSEAGLAPEHRVPVRIAPLLEEVVDFFGPLAEEQGLALERGPFEDATVSGEPAWLRQAIANLVDNAIRYTPEGGRIELSAARDPDGRTVSIAVADTGPGIDAAELERIFEPFHRVRGEAAAGPGAGIGLALVREIARAHGGDVSVESAPGRGSRFSVRLPVAATAGAPGSAL
jgi:two-component system heavy metal sensor histidine kinase CusS